MDVEVGASVQSKYIGAPGNRDRQLAEAGINWWNFKARPKER